MLRSIRLIALVASIVLFVDPSPSHADIWKHIGGAVKRVGHAIGSVVGAPFGGFVDSLTAPTVQNLEQSGRNLIADFDSKLEVRLGQLDAIQDKNIRLLNAGLADRITQIDGVLTNQINALDAKIIANIDKIDGVLTQQTQQVSAVLSNSISDVDSLLNDKLDRFDEITERRLGNLDTIATKSVLTFEDSLTRLVGIACLLVFAAAAAWRIYVERARAVERLPASATPGEVTGVVTRAIWRQLVLAAVVLLLLFVTFKKFPNGARAKADELVAFHEKALDRSLAIFDLAQATFHAAQLCAIDSTDARYRAAAIKTETMRRLLQNPTWISDSAKAAIIYERLSQAEALTGDKPDPDVTAMKGYMIWQVGTSKTSECEAARYSASAIRAAGAKAFALLPLAENCLANYLHAPLPVEPTDGAAPAILRADMVKLQAAAAAEVKKTPVAPAIRHFVVFDRLVRDLDTSSSDAYLVMLRKHANFRAAGADKEKAAPFSRARKASATELAKVWRDFRNALVEKNEFVGTNVPLSACLLNDVPGVRGAIYEQEIADVLQQTSATALVPEGLAAYCKFIQSSNFTWADSLDTEAKRAAWRANRVNYVAPLRLHVAKKHFQELNDELLEVMTYEEARRYNGYEQQILAFEAAYISYVETVEPVKTEDIRTKAAVEAAKKAADAGLYVSSDDIVARAKGGTTESGGTRRAVGMVILDDLESSLSEPWKKREDAKKEIQEARDYVVKTIAEGRFLKLL